MKAHTRVLGLLLVLAVGATVPAGCARGGEGSTGGYVVDVAISPQPPRVGPATVTVTLAGPAGEAVSGARVELEGNMSHAGMVPVIAQAVESAAGQYESTLEFTMAGDWIMIVRASLANGQLVEHRVDVPGVRSE